MLLECVGGLGWLCCLVSRLFGCFAISGGVLGFDFVAVDWICVW